MKAIWQRVAACAVFVATSAAGVVSCTGDDSSPAPSRPAVDAGTTPTTPAATTVQIIVRDNTFGPAAMTIAQGTTVRWTNTGAGVHSVTSGTDGSDPNKGKLFDQVLDPGATFEHTFKDVGTIDYFCKFHVALGMKGSVTVQSVATPSSN